MGRNLYVVETTVGDTPISLPVGFSVMARKETAEREILHIQIPEDATANDLLISLVNQRRVLSLNEQLPSMNDIFIQTVKKGGSDE